MLSKIAVALVLMLPSVSYGQETGSVKELAVAYDGDPAQLTHKILFSTSHQYSGMLLGIKLDRNFGESSKLKKHLKSIWRDVASSNCKGKFKGRLKISVLVAAGECVNEHSGHRTVCPAIVTGVHGTFTCAGGS